MTNLFENVEASLLKYCKDLIAANTGQLPNFKPFNFDTHATVNELPAGNLMGVGEIGMVNNQGTYEVSCLMTVCTTSQDSDLVLLRRAINILFDKLIPGSVDVKIVNHQSGVLLGNLIVEAPVRILPVGATKSRPIQMIAVQFGSTLIALP